MLRMIENPSQAKAVTRKALIWAITFAFVGIAAVGPLSAGDRKAIPREPRGDTPRDVAPRGPERTPRASGGESSKSHKHSGRHYYGETRRHRSYYAGYYGFITIAVFLFAVPLALGRFVIGPLEEEFETVANQALTDDSPE